MDGTESQDLRALLASPLICVAVAQEAAAFQKRAERGSPALVLITGMGPRNAQQALRRALGEAKPSLVLTCGFAGGLDPALDSGTIVFAAEGLPDLSAKLQALGGRPARFHCSDRVAVTAAEKRALRESTGADAVEMESGVICQVCRQENVPAAILRVILDTAGEDLPIDFNELMNERQELDHFRLATSLLRSPASIPGLIRLGRQSKAAAEKLAAILTPALTLFATGKP